MRLLKKTLGFLLSLKTAIWLLLAMLCILFYGSFMMPVREEFQTLHVMPLFQWMTENSFDVVSWLWAAIGVLSLLTANTIVCSIESVFKKRDAKHLLLVLS